MPRPDITLATGRHVPASLVLSNLAIFSIRHAWGWRIQGGWAILGASVTLLALATLWGAILDRVAGREPALRSLQA